MRIAIRMLIYLLMLLPLAFCVALTVFGALWGVSYVAVIPWYIFGLVICGILFLIDWVWFWEKPEKVD